MIRYGYEDGEGQCRMTEVRKKMIVKRRDCCFVSFVFRKGWRLRINEREPERGLFWSIIVLCMVPMLMGFVMTSVLKETLMSDEIKILSYKFILTVIVLFKMKKLRTDYRVDEYDCLSVSGVNDVWCNLVIPVIRQALWSWRYINFIDKTKMMLKTWKSGSKMIDELFRVSIKLCPLCPLSTQTLNDSWVFKRGLEHDVGI